MNYSNILLKFLLSILFTVLLMIAGYAQFEVLLYTETSGFDHDTREEAFNMFSELGELHNFTVTHDVNGSEFNTLNNLQKYAVVIFSNTSGNNILDQTQRDNFEAYMNNGGAYVGNHAASDTYRHSTANGGGTGSWDWYAEMMGGSVQFNPNHTRADYQGELTKVIEHPVVINLPDPWQKVEEYYYWENGFLSPSNIHVLQVASTGNNSFDAARPMSWVLTSTPEGNPANIFYTALGHAKSNYTDDEDFRTHLKDAILWAVGEGDVPVIPQPVRAQIKIKLEGFWDPSEGEMRTSLFDNSILPEDQPFDQLPFNYNGGEKLLSTETTPADWVLVELRDTDSLNEIVKTKAAILTNEGLVRDADGLDFLSFDSVEEGKYRVAIYHKSHVAVLSSDSISFLKENPVRYDFTDSIIKADGNEQLKEIDNEFFMFSGDFDQNGIINNQDFNLWKLDAAAVNEYLPIDADGNGIISVLDFNLWKVNGSKVGNPILRK